MARTRLDWHGWEPRGVSRANPFPSEAEITDRAYALFLESRRKRRLADCWCAAEHELLGRAASRLIRRLQTGRSSESKN